jgi:hypothetical protein
MKLAYSSISEGVRLDVVPGGSSILRIFHAQGRLFGDALEHLKTWSYLITDLGW